MIAASCDKFQEIVVPISLCDESLAGKVANLAECSPKKAFDCLICNRSDSQVVSR